MQSEHQKRVAAFMKMAKQTIRETPGELTPEERVLRARLILEEAFELVEDGLGVCVFPEVGGRQINRKHLVFYPGSCGSFNLIEMVDGCADLSVVNVGTLVAAGVSDLPLLEEVDFNNLAKFGPGHEIREDGKLVKPPNHPKPDIRRVLLAQGWDAR